MGVLCLHHNLDGAVKSTLGPCGLLIMRVLNLIYTEPSCQHCAQYNLAKFETASGREKAGNIIIQIGDLGILGFLASSSV